jgi:hypothetical protein
MRRLWSILIVASVLLVSASASAQEAPFAPDSEVAGFLWPAAFGLYGSRTVVVDAPVAYFVDTPRVWGNIVAPRDADTISDLVHTLRDPYVTVKDPIAAELRRRTGEDFGYADSSSLLKRQKAISQWASWARKHAVNR